MEAGEVCPRPVGTADNVADVGAKVLDLQVLKHLLGKMNVKRLTEVGWKIPAEVAVVLHLVMAAVAAGAEDGLCIPAHNLVLHEVDEQMAVGAFFNALRDILALLGLFVLMLGGAWATCGRKRSERREPEKDRPVVSENRRPETRNVAVQGPVTNRRDLVHPRYQPLGVMAWGVSWI